MNANYLYYMESINHYFFRAMCSNSAEFDYPIMSEHDLADLDMSFLCGEEL